MQKKAPLDHEVVPYPVRARSLQLGARTTAAATGTSARSNAACDWGGGDWQTGLGAASHVGRKDIALFPLEHGARMDIFAAAMLGQVEIVSTILAAALPRH